MRVILHGATGAMGRQIARLTKEHYLDSQLAAKVSPDGGEGVHLTLQDVTETGDVIVDFSHHTAVQDLLAFAQDQKLPVVIATTGFIQEELSAIAEAAREIPIFRSANMSLGVAVLCRLAKEAAKAFPDADIEIVETHHNRKLDAPSGTALMLAEAVREVRPNSEILSGRTGQHKREKQEIGIQSLRMGNVVGIHEIHIATATQTLTLKHESHDRALFAEGAMVAARFLLGKPAGLYDMTSLLNEG